MGGIQIKKSSKVYDAVIVGYGREEAWLLMY
jgi:hypothetical protein